MIAFVEILILDWMHAATWALVCVGLMIVCYLLHEMEAVMDEEERYYWTCGRRHADVAKYIVIDRHSDEDICECREQKDAALIAELLNEKQT